MTQRVTLALFLCLTSGTFYARAQNVVEGAADIAESHDFFGQTLTTGDFNGDGIDDLAVGIPGEDFLDILDENGLQNAGAVEVFYGSGAGLATTGRQFWSPNSPGLGLSAEPTGQFGSALASGDFDDDGFDDLAIGMPGAATNDGRVIVLFGSVSGLQLGGRETKDFSEAGARFGSALAAGDFDGDGTDDLAVGAPALNGSGGAWVFHGSSDRDLPFRTDLQRSKTGVLGGTRAGQKFGATLATGDFDADGFDDLAVGAPEDDVSNAPRAGSLNVFFGSDDGLTVDGNQLWHANVANIVDNADLGDEFGYALASDDFNGDGFSDLAIGAPRDDHGTGDRNFNGGGVHVVYGSEEGLTAKSGTLLNQFWKQGADELGGISGEGELFGWKLATGDFNADKIGDLVVGAIRDGTGESQSSLGDGGLMLIFGTKSGLAGVGSQHILALDGNTFRFGFTGEFGEAISVGDFNGDKVSDLAAGAPDNRCSGTCSPGKLIVLGGNKTGVEIDGFQVWRQPDVLAADDAVQVDEDNSVLIPVLDNDRSQRNLFIASRGQPEQGKGTVAIVGSSLRYQPNFPNFVDTVQFTYVVGASNSSDRDEATVTVEIIARQDFPEFRTAAELPGAVVGFPYEATIEARDVDGDAFDFIVESIPSWLTFTPDAEADSLRSASLSGTPLDADLGPNAVTIRAKDANTSGTRRTFTIDVALGEPTVPVLLGPENADANTVVPTLLDWKPVPGAATYDVQVAANATFSTTIVDTSGVEGDSLLVSGLAGNTTYFWHVRAQNSVGTSDFSDTFLFTTGEVSGVPIEADHLPGTFALHRNYPNPFNPSTSIRYELAEPVPVRLNVFDLYGRLVGTLVDEKQHAGSHTVSFHAAGLASGTYVYRLRAGEFAASGRMTLLK